MKVAIPLSLALLLSVQAAAAQPAATTTGPHNLDEAVDSYVHSYATPSLKIDKIPRWFRGICPKSFGLSAELNIGVTERLKLFAAQVGAPVETKEPCDVNVEIIFTRTPQAVLDDMAKNHPNMLGYHELSQLKSMSTMSYPIQAWYVTETRDNDGTLMKDSAAEQNSQCSGVDTHIDIDTPTDSFGQLEVNTPQFNQVIQNLYQYCGGKMVNGNNLNDGLRSEFSGITLIVDYNKIDGLSIRSVASYVAMLALSQTETFETCQPFASIINLMTPGCDASLKPDSFSLYDIAYLNALYKMNPYNLLAGQQLDIAHQMETSLGAH